MRQPTVLRVKVIACALMLMSVQAIAEGRRTAVRVYGETVAMSQKSKRMRSASRSEGYSQTSINETDIAAKKDVKRFRVAADLAPIAFGGMGGWVEYSILDRLTIGPAFAYYSMKADTTSRLDMRHEAFLYTLRSRYFVFGNSDRPAAYILAGATLVQLDTSAEFATGVRGVNRKSMTDVGPQVGLGFQYAGINMGPTRLLFNVGALYGHGNTLSGSAQNHAIDGTRIINQSVESNVFFETSIGILF